MDGKQFGATEGQMTTWTEATSWAYAALVAVFLWTFTSVLSNVYPAVFQVPVRGNGVSQLSSSFSLVSPFVDEALLIVAATLIVLVFAFGETYLPLGLRIAVLAFAVVPVVSLAVYFLYPEVLVPFGGAGGVMVIAYTIVRKSNLFRSSPGRILGLVALMLLGSWAVLSVISAGRFIFNAADGNTPLSGWTWWPSVLLLRLANQLYLWLPKIFLVLAISWLVRLLFAIYGKEVLSLGTFVAEYFGPPSGDRRLQFLGFRWLVLLVSISLAAGAFVSAYPYIYSINPASDLVGGANTVAIYGQVQSMVNSDPLGALYFAGGHANPLLLWFGYGLSVLFGSVDFGVRTLPGFLSLLLILATYLFVSTTLKERELAATASLIAAFSFPVISGINGGLYASWLGVSAALVLAATIVVGLDRGDRRLVLMGIPLSAVLFFSHAWGWLVFMGVLSVFIILEALEPLVTRRPSERLKFDLISIGVLILFNILLFLLRLYSGPGIPAFYAVIAGNTGPAALWNVTGALQGMVSSFQHGAMADGVIAVLALVGGLTLPGLRRRTSKLLISWGVVVTFAFLASELSPVEPHARLMLLFPMAVFAAMGFLTVVRTMGTLMGRGRDVGERIPTAIIVLFYVSLVAVLATFALLNVGYLGPP